MGHREFQWTGSERSTELVAFRLLPDITLSISPMAGLPSSPFDPSLCRFKQEFWALIFLYSGGPLVMNGCRLRNCAWQIQGSAAITPESLTTCGWHIIPHDY